MTIASPTLDAAAQTANTDEHGVYNITELVPAGDYVLRFDLGDAHVELRRVSIGADRSSAINQCIDLARNH